MVHARFPALFVRYMNLLIVSIGSINCLCMPFVTALGFDCNAHFKTGSASQTPKPQVQHTYTQQPYN